MRTLVTILVAGTIGFLALAMAQEWEVFARLFGPPAAVLEGKGTVADATRAEVEEALREFLALERHFYGSAGDPRFLDRMPISDGLRAELAADAEYLARNGRFQEMELVELRVLDARSTHPEHVELRTREYWVVRTLSVAGGEPTDPVRSEIVHHLYGFSRNGSGWRLDGREPAAPPAPEAPS